MIVLAVGMLGYELNMTLSYQMEFERNIIWL